MKTFTYRAATADGLIRSGTLSAPDEAALAALLSGKGLELIDAKPQKGPHGAALWISTQAVQTQKRVLCLHLQALLSAGANLEESLRTLGGALPQGPVKDALTQIEKDILSGQSPAQAFARHDNLFDPVFLSILAAGEATGKLDDTFGRLAAHLERQNALRRTLVRSVRYPLFLFVLAGGVAAFMLAFVVPQIIDFLGDSGIALPPSTRFLILAASLLKTIGLSAIFLAHVVGFSVFLLRRMDADINRAYDAVLLRLPVWGRLARQIALARLTGSLHLLLQSGLPLAASFDKAIPTLENEALIAQGRAALTALQQGAAFSDACSDLFPPVTRQMIRIGEGGGALPRLLANIAAESEREAQDAVQGFLAALEPALTLLVGGLMAWIVLAVLGPVYSALGPLSAGGAG